MQYNAMEENATCITNFAPDAKKKKWKKPHNERITKRLNLPWMVRLVVEYF